MWAFSLFYFSGKDRVENQQIEQYLTLIIQWASAHAQKFKLSHFLGGITTFQVSVPYEKLYLKTKKEDIKQVSCRIKQI